MTNLPPLWRDPGILYKVYHSLPKKLVFFQYFLSPPFLFFSQLTFHSHYTIATPWVRYRIKGTVSRDFYIRCFSWIIFPQAPKNNTRVISNFSKIRGDIHKSRCTTGINNSSGTGGEIFCMWCWYSWQILPPVLLIPVAILPPVSLTPLANLPLVFLIPVVHLDLRISPRMFEKFEMTLGLFSGAWGKMIHEKLQL